MAVWKKIKGGQVTTTSKNLLNLSQTLKNVRSLFTSVRTAVMGLFQPIHPNITQSKPQNISYHTNQITLSVFIDCLLYFKFERLIKHGTASEYQLKCAWDSIYQEYVEQSGNDDFKKLFKLSKEIGIAESKLLKIHAALTVLMNVYNQNCVGVLRDMGYQYKFDPSDIDQYQKDLASVAKKSKTIEVMIQQKQAEYDKITKGLKGGKLDENYFVKLLVELSRHQGYRINPDEIMLSEFIAIRQSFDREIRANNEAVERMKKKK